MVQFFDDEHVFDLMRAYALLSAHSTYRGSYMSVHVLLNLIEELRKRDKMLGLLSILSLFRNKFNKFSNTGAQMLESIYHMILKLIKNHIFGLKSHDFALFHATL